MKLMTGLDSSFFQVLIMSQIQCQTLVHKDEKLKTEQVLLLDAFHDLMEDRLDRSIGR